MDKEWLDEIDDTMYTMEVPYATLVKRAIQARYGVDEMSAIVAVRKERTILFHAVELGLLPSKCAEHVGDVCGF